MSNIYKQGEHRKQQMFFPPSIDEYVNEDNPVRAIEDYVELLDMVELGFTKSALNSSDGQPAYHPKLLVRSTTPETAKEHSKINLKRVGKKAYQTSKKSSTKNHKNAIISQTKGSYTF